MPFSEQNTLQTRMFCSRDLDLDPMTSIFALDVHIQNVYLLTKMKFVGQVNGSLWVALKKAGLLVIR